jgi:hypothetical protein
MHAPDNTAFVAKAAVSTELQTEIDIGPPFLYVWQLTPEITVPLMGPELPSIHQTRAEMAEPVVRKALAQGGRTRAIDIACHEGWFAHRLLEWGAHEVLAVDIRDVNVRRARLIRDHFGIPAERMRMERGDVYGLSSDTIGRFDVVLLLGLIYHLENPIAALRVARALCDGVSIVETQLTQQTEPIRHGWGVADHFEIEPASWAARHEPPHEQETQPLAAFGGVISLIPNEAAVVQAMQVAGFARVERLPTVEGQNKQYVEGDRAVFAGYVE